MIVTTIQLVLKQLLDAIQAANGDLKIAHSPELTYEQGITRLRVNNRLKSVINDPGESPVLLFNRSVLGSSELIGRRGFKPVQRLAGDQTAIQTKSTFGQFDFRFALAHSDMNVIESFEIDHVLREGLASIINVNLDLTAYTFGTFPYEIKWDNFEDLQVESDGMYYKMLTGNAIVRGVFLSITAELPLIRDIAFQIRDFNDTVMVDRHILA